MQNFKELSKKGVKNIASIVNVLANNAPVVGHVKAVYHYARKDTEAGHMAMKSASSSTAALAGATAGHTVGLGPGAVVGYVAGVNAADVVISSVDSMAHGEKRLHGSIAVWGKFVEKPSVGNAENVVLVLGMDVALGICVGYYALGYYFEGDAATASADMSTVADAGDASGVDAGGVDGAGREG